MILQIILLAILLITPIIFVIYNIYLERDIIKAYEKTIKNKSKEVPEYIIGYCNYHKENVKTYIFIMAMFIINIFIFIFY